MTVNRPQTFLIDLPHDECVDLIAAAPIGRLGVVDQGRPMIFPVNHVYDRRTGCVAFPTNEGTKLRAALDWPWVSFEVDGIDSNDLAGWSVVVVGRAEVVTEPAEKQRLAGQRRMLWGADRDSTWIRIVGTTTTGRRISAASA